MVMATIISTNRPKNLPSRGHVKKSGHKHRQRMPKQPSQTHHSPPPCYTPASAACLLNDPCCPSSVQVPTPISIPYALSSQHLDSLTLIKDTMTKNGLTAPDDDIISRIADMSDAELDKLINAKRHNTRPRVRKTTFEFDEPRDKRKSILTYGKIARRRTMTSRWETNALDQFNESLANTCFDEFRFDTEIT